MLSSLPNLLTLSRILAVPLLLLLMWEAGWLGYTIAFFLFCIAGITDYFDGYLARSAGTVSKLGQFLDPIADKIMVAAVIAAIIILLREIAVSGLREYLAGLQVSVPVSKLAKWKTTFQMVALGALILAGVGDKLPWFLPAQFVGDVCLWAAAALTLVTGYDYLRVGLKHMA